MRSPGLSTVSRSMTYVAHGTFDSKMRGSSSTEGLCTGNVAAATIARILARPERSPTLSSLAPAAQQPEIQRKLEQVKDGAPQDVLAHRVVAPKDHHPARDEAALDRHGEPRKQNHPAEKRGERKHRRARQE